MTDCEEYDEEDDDDGEVHVMNVDVHEGLHHMPDVITSECEQHGKSCLYFYNIVFVFFYLVCINLIKHFPFLNTHYISFVAFGFN